MIYKCFILFNIFTIRIVYPSILARSQKTVESLKISSGILEDKFILSLINQNHLSRCSLLVLRDKFENDSVDRILHHDSKFSNSLRGVISITYAGNILTNYLPVEFKVANYFRVGEQCMIVILMINDIRPEYIQNIGKMLTPHLIPITKKDESFYIFKTSDKNQKKLLLMNELPNKIKYKIAVSTGPIQNGIGNNEKSGFLVKVQSVCFFCGAEGTPAFVEFPVSEENLALDNTNYFPDYVWNLNGKVLRVSMPLISAKLEAYPTIYGTSNAKRGKWKPLFDNYLMVRFNCTYHMFISSGISETKGRGGTGLQLKTGKWIGVTGDVISGKADIGVGATNTPKRILVSGFTDAFYNTGCLTFVTAEPSKLFSPLALSWPFNATMWTLIGLSTFGSSFFFLSIFGLLRALHIDLEKRWPFQGQILFILASFLGQGVELLPKSHTMRLFIAFWFVFALVIATAYSSKLVTLLTFPVLGQIPKTFKELAYSEYEVGFMKHGDAAYNTLAGSTDPVYKKLVAEMEVITGVGLQCLEKVVKKKHYGCIGYDFAITFLRDRNLSETDTRKLVFAPDRTYNAWIGLTTESRSIYLANFNKMIGYTRPFNFADIWEKMDTHSNVRIPKINWWIATNQTEKMRHFFDDSDNLTMKHIAGAFYLLGSCLVLSGSAFIYEVVASHATKLWVNTFYWVNPII